jgi:secretory phospholipase A2
MVQSLGRSLVWPKPIISVLKIYLTFLLSFNDFTAEVNGETSYMALFKDGALGWANRSSNGQSYTANNYVTTVFALECNGRVHAGIDGATELAFSISDEDGVATLSPNTENANTLVVVPDEQHSQTELRRELQKRDHPRCPAGKTAVDKVPRPAGNPNGCGAADMPDFVPDGVFKDCCNDHDQCYSTCSAGFDQCNDNFLTCLKKKCDSEYKGFFKAPIRLSCHAGARIYHGAVSTAGGSAFDDATKGSCNCV